MRGNTINTAEIVRELRELILTAAPDPEMARPVMLCHEDELLDDIIPFSSVILLGVVIAVEDHFGMSVTREQLARACSGGASLRKLARIIEEQHDSGTAPSLSITTPNS